MKIAAVGQALPVNYYEQATLTRYLAQVWADAPSLRGRLEKLHENTQVRGRHLALPLERYAALQDFTDWTRHLGNGDTHWLAMKGVQPDDELQALPADFRLQSCDVLKVPGCQGQRHLLILRRSV